MHIYIFGSVCRGEVDLGSDVDLLACVPCREGQFDPNVYSIYTYDKLKKLWQDGSAFAWHLHLESKLVFSSDGTNFLKSLGSPSEYVLGDTDCQKFNSLFETSSNELEVSEKNYVFNISCMFLAIRNFATCHSLQKGQPVFSRNSPMLVNPPLDIDPSIFSILVRARLLSTRGYGEVIENFEVARVLKATKNIAAWMHDLRRQK